MTLEEAAPAEESIVSTSQEVEEKETVEEDGAFEEEDLGNDDPMKGDEEEGGNAEEEEGEDKAEPSTVQKPPPKPVKRARLAYSIFCDEKRLEIEEENPEKSTEDVATELNKRWRELDEKDQEIYRGKAKEEEEVVTKKQREYEAELKVWKDAGGVLLGEEDAPNDPPKPPAKPVKKAATAYFLFSSDRRTQLRAQNPGASVAVIAKELGKIWNTLSDKEKQPYNELAAAERERVAQELNVWEKQYAEYEEKLKAWKEAGGVLEEEPVAASFSTNLVFPVARIKKIAKLDPEVRGISKDALLLITKCAELATARLGTEAVRVARAQNRRKLLPEDVAQVCSSREQFLFLKDDIKDLVREMLPAKTDEKEVGKAAAQNRLDANFEAAAGTKRLASYFGGSNETGNEDGTGTAKPVSKKEKKDAEVSITAAKKNVEAAKGTKPLTSYFGGSKA